MANATDCLLTWICLLFTLKNRHLRQIPDDNKVSDTIIHYAEEVAWSLGEPIESKDNSSLTESGKALYLSNYIGTNGGNRPSLAYIAFKTEEEVMESGVRDCTKYAMLSLNLININNLIIMQFACVDNYCVGIRSFHDKESSDSEIIAKNQRAISYQEADINTEYMQIKISNNSPESYNFDESSTSTSAGTENIPENKTFDFTFPMSNTTQFVDCQPIIDFSTLTHYVNAEQELDYIDSKPDNLFKIDKDLRDIIKFVYQLDNVAESDTILSKIVTENNAFCGGVGIVLKVAVVAATNYCLRADTNIANVEKSTFAATITHDAENHKLVVSGGSIVGGRLIYGIKNRAVAIIDESGNVYWATNNLKNVEQTITVNDQDKTELKFAIDLNYDFRKIIYKAM